MENQEVEKKPSIEELEKTIRTLKEENRILRAKTEVALKLMALALDFQAINNVERATFLRQQEEKSDV